MICEVCNQPIFQGGINLGYGIFVHPGQCLKEYYILQEEQSQLLYDVEREEDY